MRYTQDQKDLIREIVDTNPDKTWNQRLDIVKEQFKKRFSVIVQMTTGESLRKLYSNFPGSQKVHEEMKRDVRDIINEDLKASKERRNNVEASKKNKELVIMLEEKDEYIDTLLGVKEEEYHKTVIQPNKDSKSEATAVVLASDWHLEEIVDPEVVNYINSYNPDIASERALNFFKNSLRLTDIMAKEINIQNMVMAFLGDMMSGYIHDELIEGNSMSPTETVIALRKIICDGLHMILDNSEYNLTIVMKFGNHGRTTPKIRVSTGYKNSYEWMLYHFISSEFQGNPRIKFVIEKGYHTYLQVYDKTLRFHHGDAIQYGGGVGGITIPVNKAIAQWNQVKHADIDCFGHFHQFINQKNFVSNGSLIGYNAYANRIKASYEEPQQAFFLIDRDRGKTITAPIFVK